MINLLCTWLTFATTRIVYPSDAFNHSSGNAKSDALMTIMVITLIGIAAVVGIFLYTAKTIAAKNANQSETDTKQETEDAHYCPECGTELHETVKFCPKCGKQLQNDDLAET